MATKSTITPRGSLLRSHLRGGVFRPIRTICAWCAGQNRPATVLVDVPIDDRGLSHGICPSCRSKLRSDSWTLGRGSATPSTKWR